MTGFRDAHGTEIRIGDRVTWETEAHGRHYTEGGKVNAFERLGGVQCADVHKSAQGASSVIALRRLTVKR